MHPRLRSLYRYTMCKLIAKPLPEQPVSVRSIKLFERHRPAGGTAVPAGGPFGVAFRRPESVASKSLERAGRTFRKDSMKEDLPRLLLLNQPSVVCLSAFKAGLPV